MRGCLVNFLDDSYSVELDLEIYRFFNLEFFFTISS